MEGAGGQLSTTRLADPNLNSLTFSFILLPTVLSPHRTNGLHIFDGEVLDDSTFVALDDDDEDDVVEAKF